MSLHCIDALKYYILTVYYIYTMLYIYTVCCCIYTLCCILIYTIIKFRSGEHGFHYVTRAFGVMRDQPIIEAETEPARRNSDHLKPHYYVPPPPPPYAPPSRSSSQDSTDSSALMHKESQVNEKFVVHTQTNINNCMHK